MAKSNLTQTQKDIIKRLTDEFTQLNAVAPEPQGLIDVAGIMEQSRLEKQFVHECRVANDTFTKLKIDAMLKDMESIRGDLAKLNLGVKRPHERSERFEIFPTHKPYEQIESYHKFYVNYKDLHHYERKFGDITLNVNCKYCVNIRENQIFDANKLTLAELVQTKQFKDKLKRLYEETLK